MWHYLVTDWLTTSVDTEMCSFYEQVLQEVGDLPFLIQSHPRSGHPGLCDPGDTFQCKPPFQRVDTDLDHHVVLYPGIIP